VQELSLPFRRSDLIHSDNALRVRLEEFLAHWKIPLNNVIPNSWGIVIAGLSWLAAEELWQIRNASWHLWVTLAQIDPFGTTWIGSRHTPYFGAVCAWPETGIALRQLQREFIGPALWDTYQSGIIEVILEELRVRFGFSEHPLNSSELPTVARVSWGYLIQLPASQLTDLREYFVLGASEYDVPILHHLGGHLVLVLAVGLERIKLALCFDGGESPALQMLQDWLFKQAEPPAVTTPN